MQTVKKLTLAKVASLPKSSPKLADYLLGSAKNNSFDMLQLSFKTCNIYLVLSVISFLGDFSVNISFFRNG